MSRLTVAPAIPVESLDDLVAVARAVREETARRCAEAARLMREHGSAAAAEALEALAAEEGRSGAGTGRGLPWGRGGTPHGPDLRRTLPDLFRDEAGEVATSRLATPYRAFAAAVRDAERVFAFWAYLAAYAADAEIRTAAETLAGEELDRVARLRGERRRAYRAERASASGPPLASARNLERRLAAGLDRLAAELTPTDAARARELAGEARSMADEASSLDAASLGSAGSSEPTDRTDALVVTAERLVERYLDAADAARDEAGVGRAQSLARRAIARLAWLGTVGPPGSRQP